MVSGRCLVVKVRGVMDYLTQLDLRARLAQAMDRAERAVILDLAEVSFCDSAGLNVLLAARRQAEAAGLEFALSCVPARLRRILEMTGADRVLRVFDTVVDAEAALDT